MVQEKPQEESGHQGQKADWGKAVKSKKGEFASLIGSVKATLCSNGCI